MKHLIQISGTWAEQVFRILMSLLDFDSGDGTCVIHCGNPEETYRQFEKWYEKKYKNTIENDYRYFDVTIGTEDSELTVNVSDGNENINFTNLPAKFPLPYGDTTIIIKEDCKNAKGNFSIKKGNLHTR